jgi:hypothetical protein
MVLVVQVLFFLVAFVIPVLHAVGLLWVWSQKMTLFYQRRLCQTLEVLYAWASLDVFVVTAIPAMAQMSGFTQHVIGDKCTLLNSELAKSPLSTWIADGQYSCFAASVGFEGACWLLLTAAALANVADWSVMGCCRNAIEERREEEGETVASYGTNKRATSNPFGANSCFSGSTRSILVGWGLLEVSSAAVASGQEGGAEGGAVRGEETRAGALTEEEEVI